jgi:hypothetical protein
MMAGAFVCCNGVLGGTRGLPDCPRDLLEGRCLPAQRLQRRERDRVLAARARVQHAGGQHVERPLAHVERVDGWFVRMVQQCEDVDLGLAAGLGLLAVRVGGPRAGLGRPEDDARQALLVPALNVGRRLDLHAGTLRGGEVEGVPLVPYALLRAADGPVD